VTRRKATDPTARLQRIRTLSAELDVQRQTAVDRGKTQDSKASFVLVVVGLVASVASARLGHSPLWVLGSLPIVAALAAAAEAVVVLWPRSIKVVDASALTLAWVDSNQTQEQLGERPRAQAPEAVRRDGHGPSTWPSGSVGSRGHPVFTIRQTQFTSPGEDRQLMRSRGEGSPHVSSQLPATSKLLRLPRSRSTRRSAC
jgi:hypothetical protein